MDCIVTRNIKDYEKAPIEVYQNKNVDIFSENIGIFLAVCESGYACKSAVLQAYPLFYIENLLNYS